jgi:hypothetical protein
VVAPALARLIETHPQAALAAQGTMANRWAREKGDILRGCLANPNPQGCLHGNAEIALASIRL